VETSLSIHPDRFQTASAREYRTPGNVLDTRRSEGGAIFACERGLLHIRFYDHDIVRVSFDPKNREMDARSHAVCLSPRATNVEREETETAMFLHTRTLTVRVDLSPVRVTFLDRKTGAVRLAEPENGMLFAASGEVACRKTAEPYDHFYGFGEKAGFLDKRGERLVMWNTDVYAPHNPETDPLYVSIPYFMTLRGGQAHGIFFDNTYRTVFDLKRDSEIWFQADGGALNYYFLAGPGPKDVLRQYTDLTGRTPLPPKWALGYHQSRYSYETEHEVLELVETFRDKGIPLDAVYLDIHYMDGYRVFTVDRDRFPNFEGMVRTLREKGVRVVTIIDPGVKADPEYAVYVDGVRNRMFCCDVEGNVYHGPVWPGKSAFPDFTSGRVRKWWGDQHRMLTASGVAGIWNDMNEPSVFNESKTMDLETMHDNDGRPGTHRELHNVYGLYMARATYEGLLEQLEGNRPFVLTRSGYAGIQKYAAVWTGDNRSFWEHLQMMIPMCLNLGLSGVPFTGADVGGFAHDTQPDLLVRWTQAAAFTPFFRNHSEIKCARQEPWVFGPRCEELVREAIRLRYRWLPQLYLLMEEAASTGIPPMRPLMLEFPEDPVTYKLADQFMLGPNVIVAPILRPDTTHRAVYLPAGEWVDYWTGERWEGARHILVQVPMERIPVFVRAGSALLEENVRASTAEPADELILHLYVKEGAFHYRIYDDDGETFNYSKGCYFEATGAVTLREGCLSVDERVLCSAWRPHWKRRRVVVHADGQIHTVKWNGRDVQAFRSGNGAGGRLEFDVEVWS